MSGELPWEWGVGYSTKIFPSGEVPPLTLLNTIWTEKGAPLIDLEESTPFTYLLKNTVTAVTAS